jgi:glycosyltransferase involved in cell wall biosynthesis
MASDRRMISVVICTHNRRALLARTLASLANARARSNVAHEILVIANACTDGTEAEATRFPFVRMIPEPQPGLVAARNRGRQEARGDLVAYLDDDVRVSPGWLEALADHVARWQADVIVGRVLLWWEAAPRPAWYDSRHAWALAEFDRGEKAFALDAPDGIGANFAFTRTSMDRLGDFAAGFGRDGRRLLAGEDTEYLQRAHLAGLRITYCAEATVEHWVKPERLRAGSFWRMGYRQGQALVMMKPPLPWPRLLRSLCGYAGLALVHALPAAWFRLRGAAGAGDLRHHLARTACGLGGLTGWLVRATW